MNNLPRLFKLMELTRSMPQYGYVLGGMKKEQLSDLAQHHYLVAFFAWQLALAAQCKGVNIDLARTLEIALVHDLGELFGGDIAMPYAQVNPEAKKASKVFETINQEFLSEFFPDKDYFDALMEEVMNAQSIEGIVVKLADYMEVTNFLLYANQLTPESIAMIRTKSDVHLVKITDEPTKQIFQEIVNEWADSLEPINYRSLLKK